MSHEAQGNVTGSPSPAPTGSGRGADPLDVQRPASADPCFARLIEDFNRSRRAEEIVRAMLVDGLALLGGNTATVHVLSEAGDELVVSGSTGVPAEELDRRFGRIPLSSPLPAAEVVRTGEPVVVLSCEDRRARYPELDRLRIDFNPTFIVVPLKDATGRPFGSMGVGFRDDGRKATLAAESDLLDKVTAQCALALARARLADASERDQEQLSFLDELSATLSSSLQVDTALTQLAELAVPRIADWCVVRLTASPGMPRPRVGAAHVDPAQVAPLTRLAHRLPRDLDAEAGLAGALPDGRPYIRGAHAADLLGALFDAPDDRDEVRAVGVDALAVFPLRARGRLLGVIAIGDRPGRSFSGADVELATAVASRAGVIVDNARLFHEQSVVARALQDSLLPGRLPDIPGIELGARYRAAGRGLDVGGDFYDAFASDTNWWIVAVGDVCGHGVEAAATTGLVRHTIRAAAFDGVMPSTLLRRLNEMLLRNAAERAEVGDDELPVTPRFCTVLVGAVQPTDNGVDLILCSAGHPLPLVRRRVGGVVPVGTPGTLLGVTDQVSLSDAVVHLDPGESLVCYTDGLTDRRQGRQVFGDEGVVKALYQGKGLDADALAGHIASKALGFVDDDPADDMAVLTLRAVPR